MNRSSPPALDPTFEDPYGFCGTTMVDSRDSKAIMATRHDQVTMITSVSHQYTGAENPLHEGAEPTVPGEKDVL